MMTTPSQPTGRKRQRTRAVLIDAALAVAEEKGFLAASLEEIAARAGMTKGAIYSNFSGKADLMGHAAERRTLRLTPEYAPGTSLMGQMRALARTVLDALPRARGLERLNAEFQVYVLSEPELRERVAARHTAAFDQLAEAVAREYGADLKMTPREFTVAAQSLAIGLIYQHQITPREVTEAVVTAAFEALAAGAVGDPSTPVDDPHSPP